MACSPWRASDRYLRRYGEGPLGRPLFEAAGKGHETTVNARAIAAAAAYHPSAIWGRSSKKATSRGLGRSRRSAQSCGRGAAASLTSA
jgi:hypothetical protein